MKTQIRRGVFETNSSSVHTISISKNTVKTPEENRSHFAQEENLVGTRSFAGVSSMARYL